MFGFGPGELGALSYWYSALEVPSPLPRLEASVGPVSSPHDRACELAAQLKGVRVDYGEVHSTAHDHARFGRDYRDRALWPDWDEAHPLHMVGHSLGASTIRALQDLLARDFWGWGSSEKWIASISSISGPLNGSTAVYYFGADLKTGLIPKSAGITPLLRLLELYTADTSQVLDNFYDFDLDHWGFSRRPGEDLLSYLRRAGKSTFLWGSDNAFYSASLQSSYRDNGRWATFANTYYFSYVSEKTFRYRPRGYFYPSPLMMAILQLPAWYIGHKQFEVPPYPDNSFTSADWWENDGLVPTFSQQYPHINGRHPVGDVIYSRSASSGFQPGRWYTQWERGFDHGTICSTPRRWQKGRQKRFYKNLVARLAALNIS